MRHNYHTPSHSFCLQARDYLEPDSVTIADVYVSSRSGDAAELLSLLRWESCANGILRAVIYDHSILWDVQGDKLHPGVTTARFEMLRKGADDIDPYLHLSQVLAFILANNW